MLEKEPQDLELDRIELEEPGLEESLEDLFADATEQLRSTKLRRPKEVVDPASRRAAEAASRKLRERYSNPENWVRTRGIALIDAETKTLVGNFSEFRHREIPATRKLVREHGPMLIDASEECSGYLGDRRQSDELALSWEKEHFYTCPVLFDDMQLECPAVALRLLTRMGNLMRAELVDPTQFASPSGACILQLQAGVDILPACSADTKAQMRKGVV